MAITTSCVCGKALRLRDELAGKRVRCPKCNAVLEVPEENVETDFEVVNDEPQPASALQSAYAVAPPRSISDEAPPPLPKKRRRSYRSSGSSSGRRGVGISVSPGIIGGLAAMVIAVVWFIAGLYFGWVFFYPPILFIIGLVRFVASLMGQED